MKRLLAFFALGALAVVASAADKKEEEERWLKQHLKQEELRMKTRAESFKLLPEFSRGIQGCDTLVVYEGLPHQMTEKDVFQREMARTKTVEIERHRFYAKPVPISAEAAEKLRKLYVKKGTFAPSEGVKYCGGFHPDWCLQWTRGSQTWTVHLCFGCNEMMTFHGGKTLETYIHSGNVSDQFRAILAPYQKERPAYVPLRERRANSKK